MPLQLSEDDLAKLRDKQLANAIRKLGEGKSLTAREDALLAQARIGGSTDAPSAFAKTWDELAERLNVSRKSLQNWRANEVLKPLMPRPQADGRHDVAKWAAFMITHGLKRADEFVSSDGGNVEGDHPEVIQFPRGTESDWKRALLAEKVEREKTDNAKVRGTLLIAAELELPLGATFVAITNKLTQFPERTAPLVAGFTDVPEIIAILRTEIEADLTALHAAEYLAEVESLVGELPTDEESARLLQLVSFTGQDHTALLQLLVHCTLEILQRIGRRVIAAATAPPVAHEVTGQVSDEEASTPSPGKPASQSKELAQESAPSAPSPSSHHGSSEPSPIATSLTPKAKAVRKVSRTKHKRTPRARKKR